MSLTPSSSERYAGKEQCPKCAQVGRDRHEDNLARYEDGHAWCFSCGYRESSNMTQMLEAAAKDWGLSSKEVKSKPWKGCAAGKSCMSTDGNECSYCVEFDEREANQAAYNESLMHKKNISFERVELPYNAHKHIDVKPLQWLEKYGIIRGELVENDVRWCDPLQELIFPIRDDNNALIAFSARLFGTAVGAGRKWISRGPIHDICHIISFEKFIDKPIVVVEDVVSAIKVGRYAPCMPLFGCVLSLKQRLRLRHMTKKLILWLDADKYVEANDIAKRFDLLNVGCDVIYTEQDPKACDDQTIKEAVT